MRATPTQSSIEFLATQRLDEKDALFILKKVRWYVTLLRKFNTEYNKKKLEYWEAKADLLLRGIELTRGAIPKPNKNFKSLLQQLADGDLSIKKEDHECAA